MTTLSTLSTPEKKEPAGWEGLFLQALAESGCVTHSARTAGCDRTTPYKRSKTDAAFAALFASAKEEGTDALVREARRRGKDGVPRLKFHNGQPILVPLVGSDGRVVYRDDGKPETAPYVEHEYSDTLLIFLIKAQRPEYRDRQPDAPATDLPPVEFIEVSRDAPDRARGA